MSANIQIQQHILFKRLPLISYITLSPLCHFPHEIASHGIAILRLQYFIILISTHTHTHKLTHCWFGSFYCHCHCHCDTMKMLININQASAMNWLVAAFISVNADKYATKKYLSISLKAALHVYISPWAHLSA